MRHEANAKMTVDDLVDRMNTGGRITNDRTSDREQLAIQLYHGHLPKSADHGVVDFDSEIRTVRYRPVEQFETVFDSLPDELSLAHP